MQQKHRDLIKHSLLYISIFFIPFIPYVYAKRKLRGLIVESCAVICVIIGSLILAFSLQITIDPNNPVTQNVNLNELAARAYFGIAIMIISGLATWTDSFYVLFVKIRGDKIKKEKENS